MGTTYFGQKDFKDLMGTRGTRSIAEDGSFLVAQCNYLKREGFNITPPALDDIYWSKETYTKPDNQDDRLYWNDLGEFDSRIVATSLGTGWPSTNEAIVKFRYQSVQEPYREQDGEPVPNIIDHFAVMHDWKKKLIIDSYDGKIKESGVYGAPISYAVYDIQEAPPEKKPELTITYELHTPTKQMHIIHEGGAYKWSFGNAKKLNQIEKSGPTWAWNASVEVVATAHVPLEEGTAHYYMTASDLGSYMETGRVNYNIGFNHTHLADGDPVEIPVPEPEPIVTPEKTIDDVKYMSHMEDPNAYKVSYHKFRETGLYRVKEAVWVKEYDGRQQDHYLDANETIELSGTFMRGETIYGRPYSPTNGFWFGIPMRNLEAVNEDKDIDELGAQPVAEKIAARRAGYTPVMRPSEKAFDVFSHAATRPLALSEKFKRYAERRKK